MDRRIVFLALAPFAFGTSAFVFAGLLEPMARDLGRSVPAVGQLQTAFALACALGGPALARATGAIDRGRLLLGSLLLLAATNVAAALATGFWALVAARIAGGLFGALALPVASAMAVSLAPAEKRAGALALVIAGNTIAFLIGIPLGSVIGDAFGWRWSFGFAALICVAVALVIRVGAPAGGPAATPPPKAFATAAAPVRLYAMTLLSFIATFCTIAYIGPVVTATTALTGAGIGATQVLIGVGSFVGLYVGSRLAAAPVRVTMVALSLSVAGTQLIFVPAFAIESAPASMLVVCVAITAGAAALFALAPVIQVRLAARAGEAAMIAFALNASMIFLGQGLGAALGGAVAAATGALWSVAIAGTAVGVLGVVVAAGLREWSAGSGG